MPKEAGADERRWTGGSVRDHFEVRDLGRPNGRRCWGLFVVKALEDSQSGCTDLQCGPWTAHGHHPGAC